MRVPASFCGRGPYLECWFYRVIFRSWTMQTNPNFPFLIFDGCWNVLLMTLLWETCPSKITPDHQVPFPITCTPSSPSLSGENSSTYTMSEPQSLSQGLGPHGKLPKVLPLSWILQEEQLCTYLGYLCSEPKGSSASPRTSWGLPTLGPQWSSRAPSRSLGRDGSEETCSRSSSHSMGPTPKIY